MVLPVDVTPLENVTDVNEVQNAKTWPPYNNSNIKDCSLLIFIPIERILPGIVTADKELQYLKALLYKIFTPVGIVTDVREVQLKNAKVPNKFCYITKLMNIMKIPIYVTVVGMITDVTLLHDSVALLVMKVTIVVYDILHGNDVHKLQQPDPPSVLQVTSIDIDNNSNNFILIVIPIAMTTMTWSIIILLTLYK